MIMTKKLMFSEDWKTIAISDCTGDAEFVIREAFAAGLTIVFTSIEKNDISPLFAELGGMAGSMGRIRTVPFSNIQCEPVDVLIDCGNGVVAEGYTGYSNKVHIDEIIVRSVPAPTPTPAPIKKPITHHHQLR
jgi:hypothetical protein